MPIKNQILKNALLIALGGIALSQPAQAANWLMLQGTEAEHQAPRAKLWGFIQAEYQATDNTKLKAGPFAGEEAAFNQMAPQLESAQGFNVRRARIGVRGNNLPLDSKVNYFLLAEFGNNGITTGGDASRGQLTDASITLNHLPGARIRAGLFKTPGAEEGLQAIGVFNYINFTNVTDRLLLERSFDNATGNTGRNAPVGAFRDTGVQIFDAFRYDDWEYSYAAMLGNGNGISMTDNDNNQDYYLYVAAEKIFAESKGPRRQGVKLFAWMQDGKRTLDDVGEVDRKRSGLGSTYFDGKYRLAAEYITADGMIYGGTTGAGTPDDGATFSVQPDEKAKGYYVDLGYRIIPNLELNLRYDFLDSGTETDANHREFTTTTLGAQYFVNKKTALRINYEMRSIDAPDLSDASPVHDILDSIDDRVSAQISVVF
ncbi:porin [Thiomicrorhabdus xiamenensis]|uniref:Porin n=1 Tax=Thiomicrorhabdus xiamenensis TaxID=2739063 RepID=A0A7D4T8X5_9GAMM|nr:porin [Thiomicrorhabdus xiamenensis]QKI88106.1 porin [Thiomicrorhabdus xiamenensis]